MIPSPWVYHGLNFLSTLSGEVHVGSISGNVSVTANITGGVSLIYQWYSNISNSNIGGTIINGAINNNYVIPTTLAVGTYYYYVEVSGTGGATTVRSNVATVTVSTPSATFSSVTANGGQLTQPTTQLTITFNNSIYGLTADDILLEGVSNVSKGTLSGSGPTYTLPISGFTRGGTLSVTVSKTGWNITNSTRTVTVYSGSLTEKFQWLQTNAQSGGNYTIEVHFDEDISNINLSYSGKSNITISLIGVGANHNIKLSSNNYLFTVASGVTFIIGNNVTLQGRNPISYPLVRVTSGGHFIMNNGSFITGNRVSMPVNNRSIGSAVTVESGSFTMNGGEISGNTAANTGDNNLSSYGGGVYIDGGTFTMEGGKIINNTAGSSSNSTWSGWGGGVYITTYNSIFIMNGGEISNNTAIGTGGGGGVVFSGASFTMNGGVISGNTVSNSIGSDMRGGGGVFISSGTFTMGGNSIIHSNKTENHGGGVHVGGGTFIMNDNSAIYGNSATGRGGGVHVGFNNSNVGIFRISSGTVYGSEADVSLRNTGTGASICLSTNNGTPTATYGINGVGNNIFATGVTSRNNTLKVINGILQP